MLLKMMLLKKTEYNSLKTKVDNINTTNFVLKTKYEKDGSDFEDKISKIDKKIPNISSLITKRNFNTKITEIEGKTPDIKNLASKTELTPVENKIPSISNWVTKTDYATDITKIKNIYIVYEISPTFTSQSSFTLKNSLFGVVKITKKMLI